METFNLEWRCTHEKNEYSSFRHSDGNCRHVFSILVSASPRRVWHLQSEMCHVLRSVLGTDKASHSWRLVDNTYRLPGAVRHLASSSASCRRSVGLKLSRYDVLGSQILIPSGLSANRKLSRTGLQEMQEGGGLSARAGSPELTHPAVTAPHGGHF